MLLLFLTSVNLLFSPFAADLYARGQHERLDSLFKSATRWALAATIPTVIILWVAAADVLAAFGPRYEGGETALRILLAGQLVNVATGGVAFVLIMVGRTGLDLADNAVAVLVMVGLAAPLSSAYGIEGAAVASAVTLGERQPAAAWPGQAPGAASSPTPLDYLRLALPTGACLAAALIVHTATSQSAWYVGLVATGVGGRRRLPGAPARRPAGPRADGALPVDAQDHEPGAAVDHGQPRLGQDLGRHVGLPLECRAARSRRPAASGSAFAVRCWCRGRRRLCSSCRRAWVSSFGSARERASGSAAAYTSA